MSAPSPAPFTSPTPPSVRLAAFALVVAVAFGLRMAGTGVLRPDGGQVRTPSADAHYYLRRAVQTWKSWPHLPQREPDLRCPEGTSPPWPHGLNLLSAGAARILVGASATDAQIERAAAWLPPWIGALACGLLCLFGVATLGLRAGVLAGLVSASLPISVWNSAWGMVDHHVFAGVFPLLAIAGLWHGWRQSGGGQQVPAMRDGFAWGGAATGVGYAFWTEMWVHQVILLAVALLWAWRGVVTLGERRVLLAGIARWALVAGLFALPGILTAPYMAAGWVAPHAPGRFTLWAIHALALAPIAAWAMARRWPAPAAWLSAAALAAASVAALSVLIDPGMRAALSAAVSFAGQGGVVGVIDESRPLLSRPFPQPLLLLSAAVVLSPALPLAWRDRPRDLRTLLSLWLWCTLPLALLQTRFALVYALPFSLGLGALLADGPSLQVTTAIRAWVLRGLAVVLFCSSFAALGLHSYWTVEHESRARLVGWLGEHLPYHAGPGGPRCTLAPWDLGHELLHVAGRPVVAHPFTESRDRAAIVDLSRFLTAAGPAQALAALAPREPVELVWISGMDLDDLRASYAEIGQAVPSAAGLLTTTWARLWLADGSAVEVAGAGGGASLPGYGFLRRIRTSPLVVSQALPGLVERPVHRDKVYARVRGARIVGQTRPDAAVEASIQVAHPGARPFVFAQSGHADAQGRFSLQVPYANSGMPHGLQASPRFAVTVEGEERYAATVSEQDVILGRAVTVTDFYLDRP